VAKRNGSIMDDRSLFPWGVSIILAVMVYLSLKYWIPALTMQTTFYAGIGKAAPWLAPFLAGFILIGAGIPVFSAWRKGRLPDKQKDPGGGRPISRPEFDELVREAYKRLGYSVTETGTGGAHGGVDLILTKNGEEIFVQCRHRKAEDIIGVNVVRELHEVVVAQGASGGIVICSGTFTPEALDFAAGKPMELIDGTALARMTESVKKGNIFNLGRPYSS